MGKNTEMFTFFMFTLNPGPKKICGNKKLPPYTSPKFPKRRIPNLKPFGTPNTQSESMGKNTEIFTIFYVFYVKKF